MNTGAIKHHEDLYFDDGNIALVATHHSCDADTPDEHLVFRLHQSILAKHSPVFKDMLTMPPGATGIELYEDVPLVRMTDSPAHLDSLFRALYSLPVFSLKPFDPDTPLRVMPLLLLAEKYDVPHLREPIVNRLRIDWPSDLLEWDRLEADINSMIDIDNKHDAARIIDDEWPEPASAVELARTCNVPSILPTAFYHLSRLSIEYDWDKLRENADDPPDGWFSGTRSARWHRLTREDLLRLLHGRARMGKYLDERMGMSPRFPSGQHQGACTAAGWNSFWGQLRKQCREGNDPLAVLFHFVSAYDEDDMWKDLCGSCRERISEKAKRYRNEIWNQIPTFFQLIA